VELGVLELNEELLKLLGVLLELELDEVLSEFVGDE